MRLVSRQRPVYLVAVLALLAGLTACSKSDEQKQNEAAQQQAVQGLTNAEPAQILPTYSPQANAQKQAEKAQATPELPPAFVPAPLSPDQQLRVERERAANRVENEYSCKNGTRFKAVFTRNPRAVAITFPGRVTVTLPQKELQGASMGFWYESDQYALRGRGPFAKWVMKGRDPVDCTVVVYETTR